VDRKSLLYIYLVVASFQVEASLPSGSHMKATVLKHNWEQTKPDQILFIVNALKRKLSQIPCASIQDLVKRFRYDYVQGINGDGKLLAFDVGKDQLYPSQNLEIDFKDGSSLFCFLDEEGQLPTEMMQFRTIQPNSEKFFSVAEEIAQYSFRKKMMVSLQKTSSGLFSRCEYVFKKYAAAFFDIPKLEFHFSEEKIKQELLREKIEGSNPAENNENSDPQEVIQTTFRDQEEPITHISRAISVPEMRASSCFLSPVPELNLEEEVASEQERPILDCPLSIPVMRNLPERADSDNNQNAGKESTKEKLIDVQEALSDPVLIENVPDSRTVSSAPELGQVGHTTEENDSINKPEANANLCDKLPVSGNVSSPRLDFSRQNKPDFQEEQGAEEHCSNFLGAEFENRDQKFLQESKEEKVSEMCFEAPEFNVSEIADLKKKEGVFQANVVEESFPVLHSAAAPLESNILNQSTPSREVEGERTPERHSECLIKEKGENEQLNLCMPAEAEEEVRSLPSLSEKEPSDREQDFSSSSVASISSSGVSYSSDSSSSSVLESQYSHHEEKVFSEHQESDNEGVEKSQSESPALEESLNQKLLKRHFSKESEEEKK